MKFLIALIQDAVSRVDNLYNGSSELDCRLDIAINSVSYTVSMLTVLHSKQSFHSEYQLLLERPYDAVAHLAAIKISYYDLGIETEMMGNYSMKVSTKKGYTLYTIAPTKPTTTNILQNTN